MKTTNPRKEKGKVIALKSDLIRVSDYHYHVHSQTTNRDYDVIKTAGVWHCSCPDHRFRNVCCKHIHAIEFSISIREEVREQKKVVISPVVASDCIYCHSSNFIKDGVRHNKYGDIQKFYCKNCNRYFTINIGFERMKHDPKGITTAMQLYFSGESLRSISGFDSRRLLLIILINFYIRVYRYIITVSVSTRKSGVSLLRAQIPVITLILEST